MTFKQTASSTNLVNRALGMVSESRTISDIDEDSGFTAEVARRWYKPVVARLLEMHHWGLATKRSPLVAVTNTRSAEWTHAFSTPDDMAFPVGITLASGGSTVSYYRGLAGLIGMTYGRPLFLYHNGTLFSHMTGDLEYVSFDITEADFNATFEDIVVMSLASRFALEIPKDVKLSQEYADQAQSAINLAIAQNLSVGRQQYGQHVSEAELVRGTLYGSNWDFLPLPPGG